MYPNPKTQKGQILYQIFKALTIGILVFLPISVLGIPFIYQDKSSGGFISIPPLGHAIISALGLVPMLFPFAVIMLCVRRIVCVKTNERKDSKLHKLLNILYIILLMVAIMTIFALAIGLFNDSSWIFVVMPLLLLLTVILAVIIITLEIKSHRGTEKPKFSVNVYKKPLFIVLAIIFVIGLFSIPIDNRRVGYEYDPNEYIYDRTDAFLYSYIKVEDGETKETVGRKIVLFPFNSKSTSEIFELK